MDPQWGYTGGMPKVSIYLPDSLYARARSSNISISHVAQRALEAELEASRNREWIEKAGKRVPRTSEVIDTGALLADVREEFGA